METIRSSIPHSANSSIIQSLRVKAEWESKRFVVYHSAELSTDHIPDILLKMSEADTIVVFNEADRLAVDLESKIRGADKNIPSSSYCYLVVFTPEREDF